MEILKAKMELGCGDIITYNGSTCLIVDNQEDGGEYPYMLMDTSTCKIVDAYTSLKNLAEQPDVFLIAKRENVSLNVIIK